MGNWTTRQQTNKLADNQVTDRPSCQQQSNSLTVQLADNQLADTPTCDKPTRWNWYMDVSAHGRVFSALGHCGPTLVVLAKA